MMHAAVDINDAFRNLMTHEGLLQPVRRGRTEKEAASAAAQPHVEQKRIPIRNGSLGAEVAGALDLNAVSAVGGARIPPLPARADREYETLWSRLMNLRLSPPSVLLTSCVHGEGVTTTAVQLARCGGTMDRAVLVVDLDVERGGASGLVPAAREGVDLSAVLRGEGTLEEAVRFVEPERFYLLTMDTRGTSTPALLDTPEMDAVLASLASSFDLIVFDAPPCFYAESAQRMASRAGGVILLSRQEGQEKRMLQKAARKLANANGNLLGQVQTFMK